MFRKFKFHGFFQNYFIYLSIFTLEIIAVVVFFSWKNKQILVNDIIANKYLNSLNDLKEITILTESYHKAVLYYYFMAGIIIISVSTLAVIIDFMMRKRIKEIERLSYLEDINKNSEQIRQSETKYRSLFENNGTAILVIGNNELISDCNAKFEDIIGYSRDEMINKLHWGKIVHSEDIDRIQGYDKLRRTDPGKAPAEYLMKLNRKDGSVRQVIVTVIVLQGAEQLASIVDITEMVEKDRKLKENQELLNQAQEIASLGSWSYFFDSGSIKVSDEFLSILSLTDIKDNITMDFLRQNLRFEQFYRTVTGMINSLSQTDTEITYLKELPDGSSHTMYFKIKGRIVYEDGKPVKIIGILQDITDRKRIENEINRTNKELKNLLYVASHDLQIPLISIEGFSKILLNTPKDREMDAESRSYLERIICNTQHMSSLSKNFFEMSGTGGGRNKFEQFSTNELIGKVISDNKILIDKYGVNVSGNINMPDIYGDREKIRILFHNLLTNAVIYGGKNVTIGYEDSKGFYIKDDGIGINTAELEKIFLPGERLNEKQVDGAGMGLTFARNVADMHRGRIWVESEGKNKGSVFYFAPSYELIRD